MPVTLKLSGFVPLTEKACGTIAIKETHAVRTTRLWENRFISRWTMRWC